MMSTRRNGRTHNMARVTNFLESYRYVLFMCLLSSQSEQAGGEKCEINGAEGECIPLSECVQLVSLLKNSSSTAEGLRATRDKRCGFDGINAKVCCPVEGETPTSPTKSLRDNNNETDSFVDAFPDHDICGWTDINRTRRKVRKLTEHERKSGYQYVIANGIPVVSRDMSRYMAVLGYKSDSSVLWNCGGSVITEKHILTAAHCIRKSLYVVRVGEMDLALEEKDAGPIDFLIKKMIPHEQYSMYHNDIAVLLLDGRINFKKEHHVGPICLPHDSRMKILTDFDPYFRRTAIFVAGWGEAPEKRTQPTWLAFAHVDIVNDDKCKKLYGGMNRTIDERVFCAGDDYWEHDACNGDSGGPIVGEYTVPDFNRTFFYQLGITSYGYRCSAKYFTGVYTNVTHFLPWIREKVLGTQL